MQFTTTAVYFSLILCLTVCFLHIKSTIFFTYSLISFSWYSYLMTLIKTSNNHLLSIQWPSFSDSTLISMAQNTSLPMYISCNWPKNHEGRKEGRKNGRKEKRKKGRMRLGTLILESIIKIIDVLGHLTIFNMKAKYCNAFMISFSH